MPLIAEEMGETPRLFVFLDGLEFVEGSGPVREVMRPLLPHGSWRFYKNRLEEAGLLLERIGEAHAVFLDWSNLTAEVLRGCPKLEKVAYIGVGAANFVDLEEASRLGIAVSNTPDYGNRSVAEHALGLLLAVARNIVSGDGDLRKGRWTQFAREGIQLKGRRIGLVGLGKVGSEMARLCRSIGMEVSYYDVERKPEMEEGIASYLDLPDLLSACDVVSLHVALTPRTRSFFGKEQLEMMKDGSILINTSRGEVLDMEALARALRRGKLRGAGLDNFPGEPMPDLGELTGLENVVLTPHLAFNTREAKDRMTAIAVENVVSFYRGEPRNIVNPEYLENARFGVRDGPG